MYQSRANILATRHIISLTVLLFSLTSSNIVHVSYKAEDQAIENEFNLKIYFDFVMTNVKDIAFPVVQKNLVSKVYSRTQDSKLFNFKLHMFTYTGSVIENNDGKCKLILVYNPDEKVKFHFEASNLNIKGVVESIRAILKEQDLQIVDGIIVNEEDGIIFKVQYFMKEITEDITRNNCTQFSCQISV